MVTTIKYVCNINVVYFVDYSSTFAFLSNNINITPEKKRNCFAKRNVRFFLWPLTHPGPGAHGFLIHPCALLSCMARKDEGCKANYLFVYTYK